MADSAAPSVAMPTGGSIALSPAVVGGRRRKLKLVTKKAARHHLKKLGMKMRGGADEPVVADAKTGLPVTTAGGDPMEVAATPVPATGARRHRKGGKTKKSRRSASRRSASIFGL